MWAQPEYALFGGLFPARMALFIHPMEFDTFRHNYTSLRLENESVWYMRSTGASQIVKPELQLAICVYGLRFIIACRNSESTERGSRHNPAKSSIILSRSDNVVISRNRWCPLGENVRVQTACETGTDSIPTLPPRPP